MPLGKPFFDSIRKNVTNGRLTTKQVDGLNHIWEEYERRKWNDLRWGANVLAQTYWESGSTWQPVLERGSQKYLKSQVYYPYIGAGLIQVTWKANYDKFGAKKPEDLLTWPIALKAVFDGMSKGMFTGKKLSDYFNAVLNDPRNARRIVNGTDRAMEIATIHRKILTALSQEGAII